MDKNDKLSVVFTRPLLWIVNLKTVQSKLLLPDLRRFDQPPAKQSKFSAKTSAKFTREKSKT